MKIAADTNLILRMLLNDDPRQSQAATVAVNDATLVVVTLPTLCEIAWVLRSRYRLSRSDIARFLNIIIAIEKIVVDTAAVQAGLSTLDAGGDFADGVIAHEGRRLGAEVFATFDRDAAARLERNGFKALALA
ncbi:MAG: type II toxin-antitoxin system VapC family toxin [Rhizobiaceae bacterium]|nr:type II toxin-antitoxin system VapC family toxin [Rhizobiaceae bacterium]